MQSCCLGVMAGRIERCVLTLSTPVGTVLPSRPRVKRVKDAVIVSWCYGWSEGVVSV